MGRVYGMHGRGEVLKIFWWGKPGGREGLEDLGVAGG
jgi:hypothetical protein